MCCYCCSFFGLYFSTYSKANKTLATGCPAHIVDQSGLLLTVVLADAIPFVKLGCQAQTQSAYACTATKEKAASLSSRRLKSRSRHRWCQQLGQLSSAFKRRASAVLSSGFTTRSCRKLTPIAGLIYLLQNKSGKVYERGRDLYGYHGMKSQLFCLCHHKHHKVKASSGASYRAAFSVRPFKISCPHPARLPLQLEVIKKSRVWSYLYYFRIETK